ncbi:TetR/AcrR family transcriptional regulator [Priestia endophytica]|jgi:AcrR family transcriptional regulator|uniref:TetR/AcrR family transcriptional regulator n=1 Tax=Priestia endophytica TaxID=135735 RepID=UPI002E1F23C8|nr:TetR/AcrR family transcriptional regulator [Priestia endophytica]
MKKVDRRVTKTRKAILSAYLSLLQTKGVHAISVSDITEKADINRATFYAHYEDKQNLQEQIIKEILDDLEEAIEKDISKEEQNNFTLTTLEGIFIRMLENIYKHKEFYTVMLGNNGPSIFVDDLQHIICKYTTKGLVTVHADKIDLIVPEAIYLSYVTSAQFGVIKYWIKNHYSETPLFMAQQLLLLYKLGGAKVAEYKE